MAYPLLYIDKVTDNKAAFEAKVRDIAQKLGIDPNWLMVEFYSETGGSMSPSETNPIGCVGLIQFCGDNGGTTKQIGNKTISLDELKKMSNVEQLDWVYKYYAAYAGKIKSFEDLYLIDFFPAALGWPDDKVIESSTLSASKIANQNPSFDLNKDGQITIAEFKEAVRKKLPFGYQTQTGRAVMKVFTPVSSNPFVVIMILILFGILIYLLFKRAQ